VARKREAVSFAVSVDSIRFRDSSRPRSDDFSRAVSLVLHHGDDGYGDTSLGKYILCRFLLRLPAIHYNSARDRPLRVREPPRQNLLKRRNIIILNV
jgi:hypothetical protein